MKFATKLTLLFSGLFLILCLFITAIVTSSSTGILERTIQTQMERRTAEKMDRIDKYLFERNLDTKMMSTDSVLKSKNPSPDLIAARLKELSKNSGSYISLSLYDMSRKRIVDTLGLNVGKIHSLSEYWPDIESGKDAAFDMYYSDSLQLPLFHFAKVVKNEAGAREGVLVATVSTEWLDEIVKITAMPEIKVEIVNRNGLVIYSSYDPNSILKERSIYWEYIKARIERGTMSKGSRIRISGMEEEIVIYGQGKGYKDDTGHGWTLIAHVPKEVVFAPAIELRNRLIIIMSIIGGFSLLAVLLFARTVASPLIKLSAAAEEIGRGNLDVKVAVDSNDEVAVLAKNLNAMAKNLSASRTALEKAKEEAEEATRLKDKFVTLVSHDLQTPLVGMLGMMHLLQEQPEIRPESRHFIVQAVQGNKRMLHMIDQLLDINRIRSGKLQLKLRYCSGTNIVRDAVATVEGMAAEKGIAIQNMVPDKTMVIADPVFLQQVFCNLLTNAVKFSGPGKAVTIKYSPGKSMVFKVEDSGVGIPPDSIKKIFSYHEKTSTHGTRGEAGNGFGLPLSADIMEALNGKLKAESRPEGGASFSVILPNPVPKILIMESSAGSCDALKGLLEERGFTVTASPHALKILEMLKGERFDFLLVQLSGTKETGAELFRLVARDKTLEGMPVLAIDDGKCNDDSKLIKGCETMARGATETAAVIERICSVLMGEGSTRKG
ncbi:MAG: HAMP domain-containing protein [Nitrospinae bacterium]|nr:HAMP domain-containing protein [Nitrospinota bacterium]